MVESSSRRRPGGAPAARSALAVLSALARQSGPVPAAVLARDLGLPRSTTYDLLGELVAAGFVVHLPEERRYGLGVSAFEPEAASGKHADLLIGAAREEVHVEVVTVWDTDWSVEAIHSYTRSRPCGGSGPGRASR